VKHYIVLVVVKKETEAHKFCAENLPKLNLEDNPFFQVNLNGGKAQYARNCWVELFFLLDELQITNSWSFSVIKKKEVTGRNKITHLVS
jgi:flagellar basal body rod protein FlgG